MWKLIEAISTVAGGFIGWFIGGFDGLIKALLILTVIDYITGVMKATVRKRLSSSIGFKGIARKTVMYLIVGVANIVDKYLLNILSFAGGDGNIVRDSVILFFAVNEGISILENAALLGVPIPNKLKDLLLQVRSKNGETRAETKKTRGDKKIMYINHVIETKNEKLSRTDSAFRTPQRPDHDGVDLVDANNLQLSAGDVAIIAFAEGKIADAGFGSSVGYYADISHEGKILTRYFHMKAGSLAVKRGDTVKKWQKLGIMGTTGQSTGIHLHFGVKENSTAWNNGVYVDPIPYLSGAKNIVGAVPAVQPVAQSAAIQFGDKVKIKQNAKDFSGKSMAAFVYGNTYEVMQIRADGGVVVGINGVVTAAFRPEDLQKL